MQVENSKMIYRGSNELARVYRGTTVVWEPVEKDYTAEYLTFRNVGNTAGVFVFRAPYGAEQYYDIEISKNNGDWIHYSAATVSDRTVNTGGKIRVKGTHNTYTNLQSGSADRYSNMFISGGTTYHIFGNIMSLIYGDSFSGQTRLRSQNSCCFHSLFEGGKCTNAKNLVLPATVLSDYCYEQMFSYCTSLVKVPALPATTLARECYSSMFAHCTSLVSAPSVLPATTLADECYGHMFAGCTSLVNAPVISATTNEQYSCIGMFEDCTSLVNAPALPATALARECYAIMFEGCTSLASAPALPATGLATGCYASMFEGCTSLVSAPALPATTLVSGCYSRMFQQCTSLVNAPELPAERVRYQCYSYMFNMCTSLNYIKCLATDISDPECTDNWVRRISANGTFVKSPDMNDWETGDSGIPSGWTVENASA